MSEQTVIGDDSVSLLDGIADTAGGALFHLQVVQHYASIGHRAGMTLALRDAAQCMRACIQLRRDLAADDERQKRGGRE